MALIIDDDFAVFASCGGSTRLLINYAYLYMCE